MEKPTGDYTADQWRAWTHHCSEMRARKWNNDCEYKKRHWGKYNGFSRKKIISKSYKKNNLEIKNQGGSKPMGNWSKFNEQADLKALKTDAEEIKKNGGTGEYIADHGGPAAAAAGTGACVCQAPRLDEGLSGAVRYR